VDESLDLRVGISRDLLYLRQAQFASEHLAFLCIHQLCWAKNEKK
jgi:hypothetical protein